MTTSPTPLAFGWELNRLQGAAPGDIDRELASLFASGTITRDAYLARVRDLALAEAQAAHPEAVLHGWADRQILPVFRRDARRAGTAEIYASALAKRWGELNFLYPFREGNGRSTQIFITALNQRQGWSLDWAKVERDQEIAAAQAATRTDYAPYSALILKALG